jgi:hypothetical protein
MAREIDANDRWVVVDRFGGVVTLLAVGDEDLPGVSPRRHLDRRSRELLLPALADAMERDVPVSQVASFDSAEYAVMAKPIRIPDGSLVVGALALFTSRDVSAPPEPLVGSWQWRVDTSGREVGADASLWDDNLFELHEYPRDAVRSSRGPVGDWLSRLLPYEERAKVKTTVDAGLFAGNNVHQLLTFGAITRLGSPNPGRKQLALVGTAMPVEGRPGVHFAYGFTREVKRPAAYRTTGLDVVDPADFTRAYFELLPEAAVAAVDCVQSYTFMTSPGWAGAGFYDPFEGDIAALATPDDRGGFEQFIARSRSAESAETTVVSLLHADGTAALYSVHASRVDHGVSESRYLLLSFEVA